MSASAPVCTVGRRDACVLLVGCLCGLASAAAKPKLLQVHDAWIRVPRDGFNSTIIFLEITPHLDVEIVGAGTPAAKTVELHEVVRHGTEVRMQTVDRIPLPAERTVKFGTAIGAYHLMAMNLTRRIGRSERLPLQLALKDVTSGATGWIKLGMRVIAPNNAHMGADDHQH